MKNKKHYIVSMFLAYFFWTIIPFYIKLLQKVNAYEVLAHRLFWAFIVMSIFFAVWKKKEFLQQWAKAKKRYFFYLALSSAMISINWLTYIYSIKNGMLIQSSLGYFISPLLSMLMGWLILKENIMPLQYFCILLSFIGVGYLIFYYNQIPFIALILAFSFGIYSIIHKKIALVSSFSLFIETIILLPLSFGYLFFLNAKNQLFFFHYNWIYDLALITLGFFSSLPLILYSYSMKGLNFVFIGFIQFYLPSALFLISVVFFGEDFGREYQVTFFFIWASVFIFIYNHWYQYSKRKKKG